MAGFKIIEISSFPEFRPSEQELSSYFSASEIYNSSQLTVFPGFCDVHVHLREPGFSYKETIRSGTAAAARGGYTAVCSMPNLNPVPDDAQSLAVQTELIRRDALIRVYPYGAITKGQRGEILSDMENMSENVIAFSDDGRGVQSRGLMREAMLRAKSLGRMIVAHCEDNSLLNGGYIHDGSYARSHGHRGICSESEWRPIARDIELARETGCAYHVCHVSCAESVELIRQAKADGVDISCETAPHYLLLDESDLQEDGRFKMNPPLRSRRDREALLEGIADGTVDMIATDHAPHSAAEKSKGLEKSAFGISGLEIAFPLLYTELVCKGVMTLERLIELLAVNPRKRFGIPLDSDLTVWDLGCTAKVDPDSFLSMGHSTPFGGAKITGECVLTVSDGRISYIKK